MRHSAFRVKLAEYCSKLCDHLHDSVGGARKQRTAKTRSKRECCQREWQNNSCENGRRVEQSCSGNAAGEKDPKKC
eukprot:399615-Lingulodinium_polyedra.AAC.1